MTIFVSSLPHEFSHFFIMIDVNPKPLEKWQIFIL